MDSATQSTRVPEVEAMRTVFHRVVAYTRNFTPEDLTRQTPCALWKVRDLLAHNASAALDAADSMEKILRGEPTEAWDARETSARNDRMLAPYRDHPDPVTLLAESFDA